MVSTYWEVLKACWEDVFQPEYGYLRAEVLETFSEYLNCGLLDHGAARVYCDSCRHSLLVAFSCKRRGVCPSCGAKRAIKFAEHICAGVLEPVEHRHIVFSIPKRLRPFIKYDRGNSGQIFKAAWRSVLEHVGQEQFQPGLILTLQTAGDSLNFNPHLHGLLSNCLFGPDGASLIIPEIDCNVITRRFAELSLQGFWKAELITHEVRDQILSQEHTGFSAWVGDLIDDAESKHFVSRYIERGPLALERLSVTEDVVVYKTKDGDKVEYDPLEFLALLTTHIPKKYESITRYYGHYSSRVRGERKKRELLAQIKEGQPASITPAITEPKGRASQTWAQCIKRVYEVDPLACPKCKSQMRIIAFLQDSASIKAIMKSLHLEQSRAPPRLKLKSAISQLGMDLVDPCIDDIPDYDNFEP